MNAKGVVVWLTLAGAVGGLVIFGVTVFLTLYGGLWRMEADATPSWIESRIAKMALNASLARRAPHLANPFPPSDSNLAAGMRIYRNNCAGCHGGANRKPAPFGLGFYPPAPQLVLHPTRREEDQVFYLVRNGIRRTGMTAWSKIMSDDDVWRVVGFVSRIDSLPGPIDSAWRAPPAGKP
ncbi:MAG TPA: cytochrome c [Gemmatimonadales bacterium]|nr:cytochrome c [Gemmatimonadales bacterium]